MSPDAIRSGLRRLAANYRWTWSVSTRDLFNQLPRNSPKTHPVAVVDQLSDDHIAALAAGNGFVDQLQRELAALDSLLEGSVEPKIAYCSPEFGLSAALPQYAGGLGVLAGDHLKTASDLATPLVGVGLYYTEGVFRQVIEDGSQTETYNTIKPEEVGAVDTGIVVKVPFPGREVKARVWRIEVGRVPLLLLDTNVGGNTDSDRSITDRLYAGDRSHRLEQEMVLGVGGAMALAALGWDIETHHLNEGHAGFIVLELIDRMKGDTPLDVARTQVSEGLVFTSHTPVPAGIDRFHQDLIRPYLGVWADRWNVSVDDLWAIGADPENPAMFNMAALCLRSARTANGVSELHGQVSRKLFAGVGIGDEIGFVTNGVHARTWTAPHTQTLFDDTLGVTWADGNQAAWEKVAAIDDGTLLANRRRSSQALANMVAERTGDTIDPDALIIGFARRFAPYKRASLFLKRPDLVEEIMNDDHRRVHFVFAGKAHPSDQAGKDLVAGLVEATGADFCNGRLTFIPDYEMNIASAMVQGSDIWLNNPIRPREASGTSGEKAVLNGSLNCSVLDGWWAEMYDGTNGWEIAPSSSTDPHIRDLEEATTMLETIARIATEYHESRSIFLGRIRHAWASLGARVTSARMLTEYEERVYRT
ncbi:MAG TPA: alpha-glucan family phosphorylase [Acidimicrobiia bacterium]|nr:alpha-glucan family phosphorylase [Acidimicrobiia bacterium]